MLEPVSDTEMRVHFAVPHGCSSACVEFYEDASRSGLSVAPQTSTLRGYGRTEPPFAVTGDETIVVKGLSNKISYSVRVRAHNGIDWGDDSPSSKPMKLADYKPRAPCVPVLDQISPDSVRVFCAVLTNCRASIGFLAVGTGIELFVDHGWGNELRPLAGALSSSRHACYKGVVVPGLSPDTEYEVYCKQGNVFGWSSGSPSVPGCKFRTLSDVEITGTQTQAERDLELRRQAVDADDDDDPPPASRPSPRAPLAPARAVPDAHAHRARTSMRTSKSRVTAADASGGSQRAPSAVALGCGPSHATCSSTARRGETQRSRR